MCVIDGYCYMRSVYMLCFHLFCQASAVSVDDFGRDLAGIQALQRKQEDVEKDMMALFQQIQVS